MDWAPGPEKMVECELEAPGSVAEPDVAVGQASAFTLLPGSTARTGRRISHKKSASDTFAFAAGLFQQEDFYNLLEVPIDAIDWKRGGTASGYDLQKASSSGVLPADVEADAVAGAVQTEHLGSSSQAADASMQAVLSTPAVEPTKAVAPARATGKVSKGAKAAAAAAAAAAAEAEAEAEAEAAAAGTQTRANALDTSTLDPRRAKRILANRQSAQRSRMKRLHYIHDLENKSSAAASSVKELSAEVDRMQEQQRTIAEAVEDGKTQVSLQEEEEGVTRSNQAPTAQTETDKE